LEGAEKTPALIEILPLREVYTKLVYDLSYGIRESNRVIKDYFKKSKKEREKISKISRDYALRNYSHKVWKQPHIEGYLN